MARGERDSEDRYVEELQDYLDKNGPRYREGVAKLEDPKWFRKFVTDTLPVAVADIMEYNAEEHGANGAIARISQAQLRLTWMLADVGFIQSYEEKRDILKELVDRRTGDLQ